jgi:hypothetical protein
MFGFVAVADAVELGAELMGDRLRVPKVSSILDLLRLRLRHRRIRETRATCCGPPEKAKCCDDDPPFGEVRMPVDTPPDELWSDLHERLRGFVVGGSAIRTPQTTWHRTCCCASTAASAGCTPRSASTRSPTASRATRSSPTTGPRHQRQGGPRGAGRADRAYRRRPGHQPRHRRKSRPPRAGPLPGAARQAAARGLPRGADADRPRHALPG